MARRAIGAVGEDEVSDEVYRPAGHRTTFAAAMLGLSGAFNLADAVGGIWIGGVLEEGMSVETAHRIDDLGMAFTIGRFGLLLVTATAFLIWLHRAVANARALGYAMPCSPAAAVGYWFVPCYNLFWGYKIGQELWRASVRSARDDSSTSTSGLVVGWWITYVAAGIIDRASVQLTRFQPTLRDFASQVQLGIVSSSLLVVSAVLGVMLVRSITRAQDRLHYGQAAEPPTTF